MKLFIVLLIMIFVAACTKVELGYKLAPRTMMSRLDDSFEFQSVRFDQVKSTIEKDFVQNKSAVAKKALILIDELLKLSDKKTLTSKEIQNFTDFLLASRADIVGLFRPSFAEVINQLSAEEIRNLEDFANDKIKDQQKLLSKKEKFIDKQVNTFEKVMDFLFDDMTNAQEDLYTSFVSSNFKYFEAQLQNRKNFVSKFAKLSNQKDELLDFTLAYYAGAASARLPEFNGTYATTQSNLTSTIVQIWASLNDKQRKNYRQNLIELREEISPLAN